jgi:hypothetical protein
VLAEAGAPLSDEAIAAIRDQLYAVATVAVNTFERDSDDLAEVALLPQLDAGTREAVEERAAVLEFDARMPRGAALRSALAAQGICTERKSLVDRAFLFDKHIDLPTYERQRDEIRDATTLAKIELENVRARDLDVEGLLRFSESVLCKAARLWTDAAAEQRQRLHVALFPQGLRMRDGRFGTAVTCLAFSEFGEIRTANSGMASPTGVVPEWLREIPGEIPAVGGAEHAA